MGTKKTDNHYTKDKIMLRINALKEIAGNEINVLDCFGGQGVIWGAIQKHSDKKINRIAIDKRDDISYFHLHGDNNSYLMGMDLNKFDIIDLDAYGVPYDQLKIIFEKRYKGVVFITFIQSLTGALPHGMLIDLGFTKKMINKCPTIFNKKGFDKFKQWLFIKGITTVYVRKKARKYYARINCAELP